MPEATSSAAAFIDAIKTGEFDRVKQMISVEPTLIDAKSRTGESAILTAVYHRQKEIANLLVARGASMSLAEACAAGEIERVERRLDAAAPRRVLRPRAHRRVVARARRRHDGALDQPKRQHAVACRARRQPQ